MQVERAHMHPRAGHSVLGFENLTSFGSRRRRRGKLLVTTDKHQAVILMNQDTDEFEG